MKRGLLALLVLAAGCAPACGWLLRADEYGVVDRSGSGGSDASASNHGGSGGADADAGDSGSDADTVASGNTCGQNEVPVDGSCEAVGVPSSVCQGDGFELDPDGACRAVMPADDCGTGLAFPGATSCDPVFCARDSDGYPAPGTLDPGTIRYVRAGVTASCSPRGTKACPFGTIGDALLSARSGDHLLLYPGQYREDVSIGTSDVSIQGCPGAQIIGRATELDPSSRCFPGPLPPMRGAAVCVGRGVTGVELDGVSIGGNGYGVLVYGGEATFRSVVISNTVSYGLYLLEARTDGSARSGAIPASAKLDHVAILKAGGVGIQGVGSSLEVSQSSIQDTVPVNLPPGGVSTVGEERAGLARGIALYPSQWTTSAITAGPGDFTASSAKVDRTAITGHGEIALFASGATVNVTRSLLGTLPSGTPSGRGLVLERSLANGVGASGTVDESIIEGARDAAVDVRDATLTLTSTTIRDTRGRSGDGCTGQGVRVRSLPPGDARSVVTVDHSSILRSRQSAAFAGASSLSLKSTLISGSAPDGTEGACARAMGDGVTLESYPGQPHSDVSLDRVKIDGAARAALFAGEGSLSTSATVLSCSGFDAVDATFARKPGDLDALCGCGDALRPCAFTSPALDSWATAGASPAWPDRAVSWKVCVVDTSQTNRALSNAAIFVPIEPEIVPDLTPADGCTELGGLGPPRATVAFFAPTFESSGAVLELSQPRGGGVVGFGGAPLTLTSAGWPIGAPSIRLANVPGGTRVDAGPLAVVSRNGIVLPDGWVTGLGGPATPTGVTVALTEGGWHSVSLSTAVGVTCTAPPSTRVEQGLEATVFVDCTVDESVQIGSSAAALGRVPNLAGESALGDLVADAFRDAMQADFGFFDLHGLAADLGAGPVTMGELFAILTEGRLVVKVTLTGTQIDALLEEQWRAQASARYLAVSGLTFDWDSTQPVGSRILQARGADGAPLDPSSSYTVALPASIADGTDGFDVAKSISQELGPIDMAALSTYIASLPPDFTVTGGRNNRVR